MSSGISAVYGMEMTRPPYTAATWGHVHGGKGTDVQY